MFRTRRQEEEEDVGTWMGQEKVEDAVDAVVVVVVAADADNSTRG